jgi:hypothetical protein
LQQIQQLSERASQTCRGSQDRARKSDACSVSITNCMHGTQFARCLTGICAPSYSRLAWSSYTHNDDFQARWNRQTDGGTGGDSKAHALQLHIPRLAVLMTACAGTRWKLRQHASFIRFAKSQERERDSANSSHRFRRFASSAVSPTLVAQVRPGQKLHEQGHSMPTSWAGAPAFCTNQHDYSGLGQVHATRWGTESLPGTSSESGVSQ